MRKALLTWSMLAWLLWHSPAGAEPSDADRATARSLGLDGQKALKDGQFEGALDLFQRADALYHAPTLLLGIARAQVGLGRLVSARDSYLRLLREGLPPNPSEAFRRALADAERELAALEPRIPSLLLRLDGVAGAHVILDGQEFPLAALGVRRPAEPGLHRLSARAPGRQDVAMEFSLREGERREIEIRLEMAPASSPPASASSSAPPPPAPLVSTPTAVPSSPPSDEPTNNGWMRPVGWASVGLGGAGLVVGGIWGVLAIQRKSELDEACGGGSSCPSSALPLRRSYENAGTVSTLGFGVTLLGLGAGIPLLFLSPTHPATAASPCTFHGQLGICGRM